MKRPRRATVIIIPHFANVEHEKQLYAATYFAKVRLSAPWGKRNSNISSLRGLILNGSTVCVHNFSGMDTNYIPKYAFVKH